VSNGNLITPPIDTDRGTISAEELQTIVQRAYRATTSTTESVFDSLRVQVGRDAERTRRDQQVAESYAVGNALLGAARSDAIQSGATVAGGTVLGGMLGGPPGAAIGAAIAWLWSKLSDPSGR
jgi:hypothetical protein